MVKTDTEQIVCEIMFHEFRHNTVNIKIYHGYDVVADSGHHSNMMNGSVSNAVRTRNYLATYIEEHLDGHSCRSPMMRTSSISRARSRENALQCVIDVILSLNTVRASFRGKSVAVAVGS